MYFSPREVADTRDHVLHNLLAASTACVEAGDRLASLLVRAGRDALAQGSKQMDQLAEGGDPAALPARLWFDSWHGSPARLLGEALGILGHTHAAIIQAAEAQIRVCDQLLITAIDRAARSSPWEGEVALAVVKTGLKSAESTLHSLTDVAIRTVELAGTQIRQVAGSLADRPALPPPLEQKAQ